MKKIESLVVKEREKLKCLKRREWVTEQLCKTSKLWRIAEFCHREEASEEWNILTKKMAKEVRKLNRFCTAFLKAGVEK